MFNINSSQPMYDQNAVQPMRDELLAVGFTELPPFYADPEFQGKC